MKIKNFNNPVGFKIEPLLSSWWSALFGEEVKVTYQGITELPKVDENWQGFCYLGSELLCLNIAEIAAFKQVAPEDLLYNFASLELTAEFGGGPFPRLSFENNLSDLLQAAKFQISKKDKKKVMVTVVWQELQLNKNWPLPKVPPAISQPLGNRLIFKGLDFQIKEEKTLIEITGWMELCGSQFNLDSLALCKLEDKKFLILETKPMENPHFTIELGTISLDLEQFTSLRRGTEIDLEISEPLMVTLKLGATQFANGLLELSPGGAKLIVKDFLDLEAPSNVRASQLAEAA